jgi:hypothetical protein
MRGQPARLTPFAERLLWSERRARARIQPHLAALRADLGRMLLDARDERQQWLTVCARRQQGLMMRREHADAVRSLPDLLPRPPRTPLHFVNRESGPGTRLREVLAAPAWSEVLSGLPGYWPSAAPGKVLVMTAALPWGRYRRAKASGNAKAAPKTGSLTAPSGA